MAQRQQRPEFERCAIQRTHRNEHVEEQQARKGDVQEGDDPRHHRPRRVARAREKVVAGDRLLNEENQGVGERLEVSAAIIPERLAVLWQPLEVVVGRRARRLEESHERGGEGDREDE